MKSAMLPYCWAIYIYKENRGIFKRYNLKWTSEHYIQIKQCPATKFKTESEQALTGSSIRHLTSKLADRLPSRKSDSLRKMMEFPVQLSVKSVC